MSDDLNKLDQAIQAAKAKQEIYTKENVGSPSSPSQGLSLAYKICVEMLAGVLAGGLIGYYLDLWLDTKPFLFMLCLLFGILGSGLNIYRMVCTPPNEPDDTTS